MKIWLIKVAVLSHVGMMFYQLARMSGASLYRFPWEIFASLGMASYVLKEATKLGKRGEKK
ncbi:alanine aminotransferase [Streptococcus cristatus]|uniref:Uncharacterized protein n=2 Tax=Streptococcus cristatus TaxID=45634 RepID=A0A512ADA5_STRCR|nr:hypothetical protein [Streptococcus cristatus]AGK71805.1 hypothetical protein I872_08625 [Streptococcus cristatus AS 1.3089]GEN97673.1 hypothetical protein SOL01_15470 [Streptococcus cristatus]SQI48850.1 alanine aminotransferase [Streptococcus cristatus]